MPALQAAAKRCLRCATILRQNRTVCPSCGTEVGAQPEPARGPSAPAQAAPVRTSQPAAAAVRPAAAQAPAQAPRKKVFCALCMKSLESDQARAIVRDDPQVLEALGEALIQQHGGGNACEECLETFRAKAQRQKAAAGAPAPEAAPQPAAARPSPAAPPRQAAAEPQQAVQAFETKPKPKLETQPFHQWLIGGVLGGLLGSVLWQGLAYLLGDSYGFMAIVLGGLVGSGVRATAKGSYGIGPGLTATGLMLLFAFINLFIFARIQIAEWSEGQTVSGDQLIAHVANQIMQERSAQAPQSVEDEDEETELSASGYPPDVWREAEDRWRRMPPSLQGDIRHALEDEMESGKNAAAGVVLIIGLIFSPIFLICLAIAAFGAYKGGAGIG